jgi:23S rRNA pseudouridine955/2504/2580 synthase
MNKNDNYKVLDDFSGSRLDRWIKKHYPEISHGDLEVALRKGYIKVNDSKTKSNYRINLFDKISVNSFLRNKKTQTKDNYKRSSKKEIESMLIYEDDEILVINKPHGIAVQGGSKINKHIDGLLQSSYKSLQPRLVHRIDKETSGILLVALNRKIADFLSYSFREKKITKYYWAITYGNLSEKSGVIDKRIKRKNSNTYTDALTKYTKYMNFNDKLNFMIYKPITGRNHQIRIHSYDLGVPILGDKKYGYNLDDNKKLHLHSKSIEFFHPNGKKMYFEADLPPHMQETWNLYNLPYEVKL